MNTMIEGAFVELNYTEKIGERLQSGGNVAKWFIYKSAG